MLRILALLTCTLPALLAHEGHHAAESVVLHVLTQPDHLVMLGAVLAIAVAGVWALRRRAVVARDQI